jgi:hypothetical protein
MTSHNVLAILGTDDRETEAVIATATELAQEAHGTLTLAALANESWWMRCLSALAMGAGAYAPKEDLTTLAERGVARAAEFVPTGVSVTTLVITDARRLVDSGRYDLLVIGAKQVGRRRLARLPIPALVVPVAGGGGRFARPAQPAPLPTSATSARR